MSELLVNGGHREKNGAMMSHCQGSSACSIGVFGGYEIDVEVVEDNDYGRCCRRQPG